MRGQPMVFIRLAGCSIGCKECDTDYRVAERPTIQEILDRAVAAAPRQPDAGRFRVSWVWITGGEPTDHDLGPLLDALRAGRFATALATAGTRKLTGLDLSFVSVSPHSLSFVQRVGSEIKLVPTLNGLRLADVDGEIGRGFSHRYVQPLWVGNGPLRSSMKECMEFIRANPDWSMTDQGHKLWGLP